jgi:hypothetical protein
MSSPAYRTILTSGLANFCHGLGATRATPHPLQQLDHRSPALIPIGLWSRPDAYGSDKDSIEGTWTVRETKAPDEILTHATAPGFAVVEDLSDCSRG